ncbi:MAG TPA: ABC transporter ATP-binding protein [Candidatus Woesebacteria bacterium]|nr:ABC transporter ATP-binding protein [Candidatus Woesebacteria bacterium]
MNNPVIEFKNVTKVFSLQSKKTFKEFLPALFLGEKTHHFFTALDNVSFSINKGDTVGIIGPNGSGKSTILKLVAKVMSPNHGKVLVNGNVSPLIELGAGMHSELSGRENIYLNAAILGLSRKETESKLNSIIEFAELSEFIDQPIKHYSTGMYMRLGFSIAIHVNPEILIIDEILAVGDSKFQEKCLNKMEEFKNNHVTILFVSHNISQIKNFCNKVIYIKNSKLIGFGDTKTLCQQYQDDQNSK